MCVCDVTFKICNLFPFNFYFDVSIRIWHEISKYVSICEIYNELWNMEDKIAKMVPVVGKIH